MALCIVLLVAVCAPARAQTLGPAGDQYAPDVVPYRSDALGDVASAAAETASEGSGAVGEALAAENTYDEGSPEAAPDEGAGSPGPGSSGGADDGADPGGEGPAVLPETGGPSPLALCVGTMLAGAGLLVRRMVRQP